MRPHALFLVLCLLVQATPGCYLLSGTNNRARVVEIAPISGRWSLTSVDELPGSAREATLEIGFRSGGTIKGGQIIDGEEIVEEGPNASHWGAGQVHLFTIVRQWDSYILREYSMVVESTIRLSGHYDLTRYLAPAAMLGQRSGRTIGLFEGPIARPR